MDERLKKQLDFALEIDKEKNIFRQTHLSGHGHGLKRINLVVEKYGGYINRQNEPGVFVTEIMLPL